MSIPLYALMIIIGIPFIFWMEDLSGRKNIRRKVREPFTSKGVKKLWDSAIDVAKIVFVFTALVALFVLFLWFIKIVWISLPV